MLPQDCIAFLEFVNRRDPVVVTKKRSAVPDIMELNDQGCSEREALVFWNQGIAPELYRSYVSNAEDEHYYVFDESKHPIISMLPQIGKIVSSGMPTIRPAT
jgi:hypothetical protein